VRVAWFTPWPPIRSGISAYSVEALGRLAGPPLDPALPWPSSIDVFVDAPPRTLATAPPDAAPRPVQPAHAFLPAHRRTPYDLVVYQLGNARCHDFMWPYLVRWPGLVVLHDGQLHHARARALLAEDREGDYRDELARAHPDAPAALADFAVAGLTGSPYYLWPMRRVPIDASRAVAVHNPRLAAELAGEHPETAVVALPMGTRDVAPRRPPTLPRRVLRWVDEGDGPTFAAFGLVTQEKRVPEVLRAFAELRTLVPRARLLLVGETASFYDVAADLANLGLTDEVEVTGWVDEADLDGWLALADICLCLRWPTARETSASWLRALAAGRPTVITDLADLVDVPSIDPRSWTLMLAPRDPADVASPRDWRRGVAVAIDILDEAHSLGLAMRRLAHDHGMRRTLGANARAWWEAHHTLDHLAAGYQQAFAAALAAPADPPARRHLPAHVLDEGVDHARALVAPFGVEVDLLG
jgi:glycosyltransferase involved in cell wall biosynthesis